MTSGIDDTKITVEEGRYPAFGFAAFEPPSEAVVVPDGPVAKPSREASGDSRGGEWRAIADQIDGMTVVQLRRLKQWMQENT